MSRTGNRAIAGFALLVAAAVVAAFGDFLSADRIPADRDLLAFVIPFKHFLASHLHRRELPLWNPWINMGTPFLASLHSAVLYPVSALLLLLPFPLGFNSFVFAHFFIAAAGFWLLSRERGLSTASCAVGALTFTLGGSLVSMINLTSLLQAAVWMPWLLLCWARYQRAPRFGNLALFIIAFTIFILAGAPEIVLMMLAVLPAWTMLSSSDLWPTRLTLLATLVAAVAAATGLAAFQLVPTAEYVAQSDRSGALPFVEVATWSMQPISLVQLLLPHSAPPAEQVEAGRRILETAKPLIYSIYLGIVPLCLAIGGLTGGRERWFWGAVAVAALVLALGSTTPVLAWLYEAFPFVFGRFRYPEKFYCVAHFAAAILTAEGAERCFQGDRRGQRLARAAAIASLGLVVLVWAVRWVWPAQYLQLVAAMSGTVAPMTQYVPLAEGLAAKAARAALLLGCFLAVLALRRRSLISPSILASVTAALVAVDLASIAHGINHTVSWRSLQDRPPLMNVDVLRDARQRMFLYQTVSTPFPGQMPRPIVGLEHLLQLPLPAKSSAEAAENLWQAMFSDVPMVAEVGTLSGDDDGITRSSDIALREAVSSVPRDAAVKLLRTFGVAELAGSTPLETSDAVLTRSEGDPPTFVYRVREPLSAVYLASRLVRAMTPNEVFRRIVDANFIPGVDVVVETIPPEWQPASATSSGDVRVVTWTDRRIDLSVQASRSVLLVVNDAYFPGWIATIDGRPARIERANYLARGIVLGGGSHRVEMVYKPRSLFVGMAISIATALALAGITAFARRQPVAATRSRTS